MQRPLSIRGHRQLGISTKPFYEYRQGLLMESVLYFLSGATHLKFQGMSLPDC
jgi:hypothetical protein